MFGEKASAGIPGGGGSGEFDFTKRRKTLQQTDEQTLQFDNSSQGCSTMSKHLFGRLNSDVHHAWLRSVYHTHAEVSQ